MKCEELRNASNKQSFEFAILKFNSAELEQKTKTETAKIDKIDQYSRGLNLEFHDVPAVRDEDVFQIVVNLCKKLGVDIQKHNISTARIMPKRFPRNSNPPAIIARFMNRDVRNKFTRIEIQQRIWLNKNSQSQECPNFMSTKI